jgi:hypothetical protein
MGKKRQRMNEYRRKVRKRNKTEFFMNGERKKGREDGGARDRDIQRRRERGGGSEVRNYHETGVLRQRVR